MVTFINDDSIHKPSNDIPDIKRVKQLEKLELDLDSPRLKKAMESLGLKKADLTKKLEAFV